MSNRKNQFQDGVPGRGATGVVSHVSSSDQVVDPGGGQGGHPPFPVKIVTKQMTTEHGGLYFMLLGPVSKVSGSATVTAPGRGCMGGIHMMGPDPSLDWDRRKE